MVKLEAAEVEIPSRLLFYIVSHRSLNASQLHLQVKTLVFHATLLQQHVFCQTAGKGKWSAQRGTSSSVYAKLAKTWSGSLIRIVTCWEKPVDGQIQSGRGLVLSHCE